MTPTTPAPIHCVLYPELAEIARENGYAMAVHGSMARDFDLVCIPWVASATEPQDVIDTIVEQFAFEQNGKPEEREHGRVTYSLIGRGGWCGHVDISFMPRVVVPDHRSCCRKCGCMHGGPCPVKHICRDCFEDRGEDLEVVG